jgi:SAM-dependent methyltransferase
VKTLDLGCGAAKTPGAFGVDRQSFPGVDLTHDLDVAPWPLPDNEFDAVTAKHIIEHVADPVAFMNEAHRVAKPGARMEIVTPHFSNRCAYADPTHRRALSARAFDFLADAPARPTPSRFAVGLNYAFQHRYDYPRLPGSARFVIERVELSFSRVFRWLGVAWFANRFLDFYEFYLAWTLPGRDLHVTLRVEKDGA